MSSLSPPLSLPGLHAFAITFALEVTVGKTNTVTALNNSDVLLPCSFTTCTGFQDLIFTWYFNSTEMVGASPGFPSVFLAGPSQWRPALQFSWSSLSPLAGCPPSDCLQPWGDGAVQTGWLKYAGTSVLLAQSCSGLSAAHRLVYFHKLAVQVQVTYS